jgi:hypothetical protein
MERKEEIINNLTYGYNSTDAGQGLESRKRFFVEGLRSR